MEINNVNGINGVNNTTQPHKKKEIQHDNTYQGERVTMDTANPAEMLGRSTISKKVTSSVCLNTKPTELISGEKILDDILLKRGIKTPDDLDYKIMKFNRISDKEDFKLTPNEKSQIIKYIMSGSNFKLEDLKDMEEENLCCEFSAILTSESPVNRWKLKSDILKSIGSDLSEPEAKQLRQNFEENFKNFSLSELYYLSKLKPLKYITKDELLNFDFNKLHARNLLDIVRNQLGTSSNELIDDFLFCSDEEFQNKIQRFNERPFLIENMKKLQSDLFQTLYDCTDEEYTEYIEKFNSSPIFQRDINKINKNLFESLSKLDENEYKEAEVFLNKCLDDGLELKESFEFYQIKKELETKYDQKFDVYPISMKEYLDRKSNLPSEISGNKDLNKDNILLISKLLEKGSVSKPTFESLITSSNSLESYIPKLDYFNKLSKNTNLDAEAIGDILAKFDKKYEALFDLVTDDGIYPQEDISLFLDVYDKRPNLIEKLIQNNMDKKQNVPVTINTFEKLDDNVVDNIFKNLKQIKEEYNLINEQYKVEKSNIGDDSLILMNIGNELTLKFSPETGELLSVKKADKVKNTNSTITTQTDYKLEASETESHPLVSEFSQQFTDEKGNIIKQENFLKSDITGEYQIWQTELDGTRHLIGLAEKDENGNSYIEKTLTSLDGTTTNYVYSENKQGNNFLYQKIVDKDGKVLYEVTKKTKQLSENHYQSFVNDQCFDVQISDDKVVVSKMNKDQTEVLDQIEYKIKDFNESVLSMLLDLQKISDKKLDDKYEYLEFEERIKKYSEFQADSVKELAKQYDCEKSIDRNILPLLRKLSGNEWMNMFKTGTNFVMSGWDEKDQAASISGAILVSDEQKDRLSTFIHELGHEKFRHLNLQEDEAFKQIYEEEKKLFTATFPDMNIKSIAYFLSGNDKENEYRGLNETVAESNLLLNTHSEWAITQDRTALLQQYFPRTIAYVAQKLQEIQ